MPSAKQEALADLMHWLICLSRGPQSYGWLGRLRGASDYDRVLDDLYLIHKIPLSILDADFTQNDIDFLRTILKGGSEYCHPETCRRI